MKFKLSLFFYFTIGLCFSVSLVKAQNNTNPGSSNPLNTYLNNFVQPPPNAASLGKYADYPVGYYTGVPNISIPIYNLKDGGISLPISLSYHASGIHVSELASWVGLGWALNATGVINRTVRGAPDEGSKKGGAVSAEPKGYYRDHGLFGLMLLPYPVPTTNACSDQSGLFYTGVTNGILVGAADCEPDLYTFNFNGHAGKFVFDEKGVPRLLEDDNLKIRVRYDPINSAFISWVITAEDGIQYYFGENNAHELVRPHTAGSLEDADVVAPSSWYLTHIYNPNTKETATFNYANEGYSYNDLGPENQYYGGLSSSFTDDKLCDNSTINAAGQVSNFISTTVQGLKLVSIVTNNFTVKFIASTVRTDVSSSINNSWINASSSYNSTGSYSPPCSLDSIKIYTNLNNICIKQFALGHSYFASDPNGTVAAVLYSAGSDVSDTKRLKLTTVTEIAGDATIQKPPYVLTYQESFQLPRRLSYDQDHWGFANHSAGNNNRFFTPTITNTGCTVNPPGANRHPTWPDMSAFTLTGIKDPLGVTTAFTFSPHSASNTGFYTTLYTDPPDTLVGGLRIQQISVTDNVTGITKYRSFNYDLPNTTQPGGAIIHIPIYLVQVYSEYFQNLSQGAGLIAFSGYIGDTFTNNSFFVSGIPVSPYLRQSQGIVPMQDANGNHVVYPYVKESFGQHGEGGYKAYTFSEQSQYISNPTINSRLGFSNYAGSGSMYLPGLGGTLYNGNFGNGHLNDTTAYPGVLPQNLTYSTNLNALNSGYPFSPQQIDVVSGKTLEEDTYDSANNLLESVTNSYSTNYHENFWIRGLKAHMQNWGGTTINNGVTTNSTAGFYNSLTFYKLHTGISHLVSTTKVTYKGANSVTEVSSYGYESPYHTLKTSETTTSSQGDVLINKTYYSFDYANSATADNVFGKMKARNLLFPVSTHSWKNGNLVGAKITLFKDFAASAPDTLINPANVYALESVAPLTPVQANESTPWSAPVASLVPNSYFIPKANFSYDNATGKLTGQQLTNSINHSVVWDTRMTVPIAIVDNAYNNANSVITTGPSTGTSGVILPSTGGVLTYSALFTVTQNGSSIVSVNFIGNSTAVSPSAQISCRIKGITNLGSNYDSGPISLCISSGLGTCSGAGSSTTVNGLLPGQYTFYATYTSSSGLGNNLYVTATYPTIASTTTYTGAQEFYYQGFEQSAVTDIYPGVYNIGTAHTGTNYWNGNYTVNLTVPNARSYVISYWYLSSGAWKYQTELPYTGPSLVLIGGTAYDDIRIHPADAQMTTYTYDQTGNVTSITDPKSLTSYYEYDSFQRLMNIRDKDNNIVKNLCYNYAGQANGCYLNLPIYTNAAQTVQYTAACTSGYSGSAVNYVVPQGRYTSAKSQVDADNQATAEVMANGQHNANVIGSCTIDASFILNNSTATVYAITFTTGSTSLPPVYFSGSATTIQLPVGTYTISVSPTTGHTPYNIGLTSQPTQSNTPYATFNNITISTGATLTLSIQ